LSAAICVRYALVTSPTTIWIIAATGTATSAPTTSSRAPKTATATNATR
jgi:hypothetical protein